MVIGVIIIEARLIINVNIDARGRGINVLRLRVDFFSCNEVSMIYHKESCRTIEKKTIKHKINLVWLSLTHVFYV